MKTYEEQAKLFVEALKTMASRENALNNFQLYLENHFAVWLAKYANTPDAITAELKAFAEIEF
jgi:hypothetical protein